MYNFQTMLHELSRDAKKTRTPIIGVFELTGRCNFNCVMCYVHELNHDKAQKQELSTSDWISIFDSLIERGMIQALLTGGECLLRTDFKELYLYLTQHGVRVSVNTNGFLLDESYIDFFKKYPPVNIQISIYGSSNDAYANITERPAFDRVSNALSLLKEARIPFSTVITPCRQLLPDFENIVKFLIANRYRYLIGEYLIENKSGDVLHSDTALSYEEHLSLLKTNAVLRNKLHEPPEALPKPFGPCSDAQSMEGGIPCSAGTCRAAIDWHGDLYSCYVLPLPRFSVTELGFDKAWELMGNEIAKVKRPLECVGCAYEKLCSKCPAVRYDGLFSGHCNRDCCDSVIDRCKRGILKAPSVE